MKSSIFATTRCLPPWEPIAEGESFEAELRTELMEGHPLFGISAVAVARRIDKDEVLFSLDDPTNSFSVVLLSWRMKPETIPNWPLSRSYRNLDQWVAECMRPDNLEYNHKTPTPACDKGEVIKRHAAGESLRDILAAYQDPDQRLAAASVLAGLPDLRRVRKLRPLIWILALFFALFASLDILAIVADGIGLRSLISLLVNGASSLHLDGC